MSIIDIVGQIAPTLMMCLLVTNIFQLRFNKRKTIIIFFLVSMLFYLITYAISNLVLIKAIVSLITLTSLLVFLSAGVVKKRVISIIVFFAVIFSAEGISNWILTPLVDIDYSLLYANAMNDLRLIMVAVFSNLFIIEVIIVSVIYKDIRKDIKIIIIALMLFVFIPQIIFILSILSMVKSFVIQNSVWFILISSIITLTANIIVYILIDKLVQIKKDEAELSYLKEQSKLHYDYYRLVMENARETAVLRHEISNQLQTAYSLLDDTKASKQDALRLLNGIDENLSKVKRVSYCGSPIINAILSTKTAAAHEKKIETDILICNMSNNISDMDMCSLFCNLYDNAIEACEKVEDPRDRFIRIRAAEKSGLLVIEFANSCNEAPAHGKPLFLKTTKKDKRYHGYGMKLIRSIVQKYEGHLSVSLSDGNFKIVLSVKIL